MRITLGVAFGASICYLFETTKLETLIHLIYEEWLFYTFRICVNCRNFQMLERQSRVIHLQFLKDVKLQQMTDSQQEMLLYHLKDLSFLEVRT